jgi:hypothetical protein
LPVARDAARVGGDPLRVRASDLTLPAQAFAVLLGGLAPGRLVQLALTVVALTALGIGEDLVGALHVL